MDGAGAVRLFFSIQLPQMKKPFLCILLFAIMSGIKMFREAYVVTGEYPAQYIYMIQNLLNNWYRQMEIGKFCGKNSIAEAVKIPFSYSNKIVPLYFSTA